MCIIRLLRKTMMVLLLLTGGFLLAESGWICAKAELAQKLIEQAWGETLDTGLRVKPWPWADTWPVARLQSEKEEVDLFVLNGTEGNALAFAPGLMIGSAQPGEPGVTIIAGHRDTHFRFMARVQQGDSLQLINRTGQRMQYVVQAVYIVDSRNQALTTASDQHQ